MYHRVRQPWNHHLAPQKWAALQITYLVLLTAAPTSFAEKYCFPFEDDQNILILTEFFKFLAISIIT